MVSGVMKSVFKDILINLWQGARLVFFFRPDVARYRFSQDQAVFLLLVDTLLSFLRDLIYSLPHPEFNSYGLPTATFGYMAILFSVYLVSRVILRRDCLLALFIVISSTFPVVLLVHVVLYESLVHADLFSTLRWVYLVVWFCWLAVILYRAVSLFVETGKRKPALSVPVFFLVWILPGWLLVGNVHFWYPGDDNHKREDPYARYRKLDVEAMYYAQPALLSQSLSGIKPQRHGKTDLYFIAFAGWARQDVFLKEARFVRDLFDQRFGTRKRSLLLINNLKTYEQVPLATSTNLQWALKQIGEKMDRDEDMLVLFMTSHGSRSHKLNVDFWPMRLNDVTPDKLRQYLDDAGIKWRVLFVSACYSGGFVEKLKDKNTLIVTAAAPDRMSFGCSDESDFTYFGEVYFKQQLTKRDSFIEAFALASQAITQRELQEKYQPSMPQLYVGEKIQSRLYQLERELAASERPYQPMVSRKTEQEDCQPEQAVCE